MASRTAQNSIPQEAYITNKAQFLMEQRKQIEPNIKCTENTVPKRALGSNI